MKSCDVIGYTYNADYHCTDCAIVAFGEHPDSPPIHRWCADGIDADGNAPTPITADAEWWDRNPDPDERVALICGTCGDVIDEQALLEEEEHRYHDALHG
jgi:hypothetical protein